MLNGKGVPGEYILLFNILKIIFLFIGTISIYFIYSMLIEKKKKDIGIMISLGMNEKQLKKLLLIELFIINIISFISAIVISNIIMYIIIQNFMLTDSRNYILIMYKFSFSSTVFLFFISIVSILTAFYITLQKILSIPIIDTIQRNDSYIYINRNANIQNKSSAVKYITKINILRNKKHFISCSVISLTVICVITVFFNFINVLLNPSEIGSDFTIVNNDSEIILEDIEYLENITGIKNIEYNTYYNNFLILQNTENKTVEYHHISIRVLTDEQIDLYKNYNIEMENQILLSKNIKYSKYQIGDTFIIHNYNSQKSLTIAGFIDVPQKGDFIYAYVTKDNFEKIVGKSAIPNSIYIYADDNADISKLRKSIYNLFDNEDLYNIIDNIKIRQDGEIVYKGLQIIIIFLCSVLAVCAFILLWAFISFYIINQKSQIKILGFIGATKKTIQNIIVYESFIKGVINGLAGLLLGTFISYIIITMNSYNIIINIKFFIVYGIIIIITVLAHIIPAYINILKVKEIYYDSA